MVLAPSPADLTIHTDGVVFADNSEGYRQRLEAKLQPQRIRATLSFAGLYQITHEMIKQSVLEEVRLFYRHGFDETGWQYHEEGYKRQVLSGAPKDRFRASLLWLVDSEQRPSHWPRLTVWTPSIPIAMSCRMS